MVWDPVWITQYSIDMLLQEAVTYDQWTPFCLLALAIPFPLIKDKENATKMDHSNMTVYNEV